MAEVEESREPKEDVQDKETHFVSAGIADRDRM